ncbi:hypothetical protein KBA63_03285 [Candidatus Woesebacteria bacterium]|nr:hypothetical protein [Candidatus Woesebacteria bacterium]MBP9687900.1 hypothetical protein [Candidatus Woesebacteria bacterium]
MIKRTDTLILPPSQQNNDTGAYLIEILVLDEELPSHFNAWTCTTQQYDSFYRNDPLAPCFGRAGGLCFVSGTKVMFWGVDRAGVEATDSYASAVTYAKNRTIFWLSNQKLFEYQMKKIKDDPILSFLQAADQWLLKGHLPPNWTDQIK